VASTAAYKTVQTPLDLTECAARASPPEERHTHNRGSASLHRLEGRGGKNNPTNIKRFRRLTEENAELRYNIRELTRCNTELRRLLRPVKLDHAKQTVEIEDVEVRVAALEQAAELSKNSR